MRVFVVFVVVAVVWHLTFLLSIFDVYFKSPIVHGMKVHEAMIASGPAERVLLFVADGLRADKFFEMDPQSGKTRAPFLRRAIEEMGAWGVSHCHVPTESRPGHVSILGGIYEDVSAVTRGWKSNPVLFDTVFNHTAHSWALGSPDIVPMFSDPLPQKVTPFMYDENEEDFSVDASFLDLWVFDTWEREVLNKDARILDRKTFHFFHLLGLDTHGHGFRPYSQKYLKNIELVDRGIERVFLEMEKRFPDKKTAYVFTSDHGMSDKGSHGSGDPTETQTPIVVWGSGVRSPVANEAGDHSPRSWELDHLKREDIQQADIAPLLSTLLGVPIPLNNVGILPENFLSAKLDDRQLMMRQNALQIAELLETKHTIKQRSTLFWFSAFPDLIRCHELLEKAKYLESILCSQKGLLYYDTYDRTYLYITLSATMVAWIACIASLIAKEDWSLSVHPFRFAQPVLIFVWWVFLVLENAPFLYFLYSLSAVLIVCESLIQFHGVPSTVFPLLLCFVVLQTMVAGFFWRELYGVLFVLLAAVYWNRMHHFSICLVCCGVFPLIPVDFGESTMCRLIGGCCCVCLMLFRMDIIRNSTLKQTQVFVTFVSLALACFESRFVPSVASWVIVSISGICFSLDKSSNDKELSVFLALCPFYALLSISYELIFFAVLCVTMTQWIKCEDNGLLENGLLYMLLTYLTFFGTGNSGSISSFEISSTYRFVKVFNPFLMGLLLLIKAVLPFIVIALSYSFINMKRKINFDRIFMMIIAFGDVMALTFFFLVKDDGSWRDIGVSISHFGIANAHIIVQLTMYPLPHLFGIKT